jgi:hypothetical protein
MTEPVNLDPIKAHLVAEVEQLRARAENAEDKALRFDLDAAGIEARERDAVELVELRAKLEATQRERDAYHEAWAEAQARLDCGADATEAVREERAAVVAALVSAANAPHPIEHGVPSLSPAGRGLLLLWADRIERGAHRDRRKE